MPRNRLKILIPAVLILVLVLGGLFWFGVIKILPKKAASPPIFNGFVIRITPSNNTATVELLDMTADGAAKQVTKSFLLNLVSSGNSSSLVGSASATPKSYSTSFGEVQDGDVLVVTYSGSTSPYQVVSLENASVKNNTRHQSFLHGSVTEITGDTLKINSEFYGNYSLKIEGLCLINQSEASGSAKPIPDVPITNFSSLKVGDEISVFYSRNDGQIIVPDKIDIL